MPHTYIVQNSEVLKQISDLRELITSYQLDNESGLNQFIKWSAIAVVLISLGGQYWIFKLNKEKEIKLKVAELYGKYKSRSIQYLITFYEYNEHFITYRRNEFLLNYYSQEENQEYVMTIQQEYFSEEDYDAMLNNHRKWMNDGSISCTEYVKKHVAEKLELVELLHQIHFYINTDILAEKILKFQKNNFKPIEITEHHIDLTKPDFFNKMYSTDVKTQIEEIKLAFSDITKILLNTY